MNRQPITRLVLLGGLVSLLTLLPGHVLAAQPEVVTFVEEGSFELADCGSFTLTEDYVLEGTNRFFFDQDGNRVGAQLRIEFRGVITNSATGATYADTSIYTRQIDYAANTRTIVGLHLQLIVPGQGAVVLEAGRVIIERTTGEILFEAGRHARLTGEAPDLCQLLA